jgi:acetoin utilization deacetylase AcuC-like enzyme
MEPRATRRDLLKWPLGTWIMAQAEDATAAGAKPTMLLVDPVFKEHDTGPGHPERPERYDAVTAALTRAGLLKSLGHIAARAATEDEVALCHGRAYIARVKQEIAAGARELSTGDTTMGPRSWDVALDAVGGMLNAVDTVMDARAGNAFCAVRPPGHHARPNQGMGFCIFNNVAIAARYAQKHHGVERVLIADWDVHHGNGTQDTFYSDGSVFFFSTHQSPWYPGTGPAHETGEGKGKNCTMNRPFPAGAGRNEILEVFRRDLARAAQDYKPDLVFVSAGFDSRLGDPLGQFTLSDPDFSELTRVMLEIADKHAGGRLVSVLEGGYSLAGLASAATAHVQTLAKAG